MANYNIGPKIGIEGEKEFRAQISRINKEYASMESYTKAVTKAMDQNGKSQDLLESKANSLRQQINLQQQKFEELYAALSKTKAEYGDNSQEVMRFEGAILDVKNTSAQLQKELDATEDDLRRMADGLEDVGDAAGDADEKVLSFGDVLKAGLASGAILGTLERAGDVIVDVGRSAIEAAADVKAANSQFEQTFGELEGTARNALRAVSSETGIAVTRLQSGYSALYAFTKSVGGDSDTALNIAQRALTAAADSAAYYDRTMEDATETLQSFLKGNYENDAALGIAATETTRNAKANELYAKSFKELTEAQKVDTLLAMVEAGNAASGALGQAAREADSWTNATGELSEAWRQLLAMLGSPVLTGLTPIIQGITSGINQLLAVQDWQTLNSSVAAFEQGMRNAETALADSNAAMAATSGLAQRYVDKLRELESTGLSTADSQREYAQTVELLNTLMPELGLTINDVTGRLDQNTWAIQDNITALKEQAEQQAKQAYYKQIIDSYSDAYQAQYAAQMRLIELQEQEQELLRQGADATIEYNDAMLGSTSGMADLTSGLSDLDRQLIQNRAEQTATANALAESETVLAGYAEQLDAATEATGELADGTGKLTAATDPLSESVQELRDAYNESATAARESIDSQIGLFDKLSTKSEMSAKEIVENWGKQKEAFAKYSDNLQKAVDMGLDQALVQQLSDGSQQSMVILNELVNSTKVGVDDINAAFQGLDEAKNEVSSTMADIEAICNGTYDDMFKAAKDGGYQTVAGLAEGIRGNISIMENAMRDMGKKAQAAYNRTMEIHSPSRVMERAGAYTVAGAVQGVERNVRDLETAMADMARAGNSAYLQEQLDYVAQYPSMIAGAPGYGGTTNQTSNVAYGGISINITTQAGQDAHDIAAAVVQELTARFGREEDAF